MNNLNEDKIVELHEDWYLMKEMHLMHRWRSVDTPCDCTHLAQTSGLTMEGGGGGSTFTQPRSVPPPPSE